MATYQATATAPVETKTHTSLEDKVFTEALKSGDTASFTVGIIKNTGNVSQNLDISANAISGCSINRVNVYVDNVPAALPVSVAPGAKVTVAVTIDVDTLTVGAPDQNVQFNATDIWS